MKKLTFLLMGLLLMLSGQILSQDMAVIQGKIYDEKSMQPVPYANVSLYTQKDSALINGAVTNEQGEFDIKNIKPDNYYLKVSYMGYQNKLVDKIEVNSKTKIDVGNINLIPSEITLSEVNVVGDKLKGEEKVDRTVYAVTQNIKAISSSGLDVLKHIPSVSVDLQENISLEGNQDIAFYVDGVLRDKNFVSQLSPETIDRIEILTNPGARYGADVSGVIEIFLKKEKRYGMNGSFTVDIPSPPTYLISPQASLDYGFSNVRMYISDRLHLEKFNGFQETNSIRYLSGQANQQINTGEGNLSMLNNNIDYGIDWFISDKNTLNLYGNISSYSEEFNDMLYDSRQLIDQTLVSKERINMDQNSKGKGNYYSLFYKHQFENPEQKLTMQGGYYDYSGKDYQYYAHYLLDMETDEVTGQYDYRDNIDNTRKSTELMVDYSQGFKKSSLEAGIKSYYQWFDNNQTIGSDANNYFIYNELRNAAYINYLYKFEKFSIQTGLRAEMSNTNIDDKAENNYFCLLPQFSIIKQFKNSQNMKLNFRRRIFRPGISDLNPFEVWSDSLHVQIGNPNLEPAYSNNVELVYSKNFNSSMVSPKIYAKYVTGNFQNVYSIRDDQVMVSKTENVGKSFEYGFSLNYALKLNKWWMINGYVRICNTDIYSAEEPEKVLDSKISFQTDFTSIMTFFKTWNVMMMMNYRSPYISYQQTNYRDALLILGLEKELLKNGKLQVLYIPPYTKKFTFQRYVTETEDVYNSWKGGVNFDYVFVIEFSYSFSTGKKVKSLERSTDFDSETNKSLF